MSQRRITDDLHALLGVLPPTIAQAVTQANNSDQLLEIVIDLGRHPMARFVSGDLDLSQDDVTREEIDFVVSRISDFDADNRAGLERTLHRISAIRNRRGHIVGLTCRVGRAVYGTIDIVQDLIESGKSVLILGRPGIGKTTMLREAARILAEKKRVVIVDTSNEIGGDGDVPHPAVGRARRMQVAAPSLQHEVMIEAVENHNPEVIVIDEIGRELEAAAARTIAERGVQLIGTAHGRTLENLLLNPTLSDLVGGIEAVTLSDDEARRRGTQKTVLERRSPPTFDVLIEIIERDRLAIQADVAGAVDALVRSNPLQPEIRYRADNGDVRIEKAPEHPARQAGMNPQFGQQNQMGQGQQGQQGQRRLTPPGANSDVPTQPRTYNEPVRRARTDESFGDLQPINTGEALQTVRIFPYGVARNRLMQSSKRLGVPAVVVRDLAEADVLITLRTYYRGREQTILEAEQRGMPIYVLRANTNSQIEQLLGELFNLSFHPSNTESVDEYVLLTQSAIQSVMAGERYVDLAPASAPIRRLQHELAREAQLVSHSFGKEPNRRVRIYRD